MKHRNFANRESIRVFQLGSHTVAIVTGKKSRNCPGPRLSLLPSGRWGLQCECPEECVHQAGNADDYFIVQSLGEAAGTVPIDVVHQDGCDEIRPESLPLAKDPESVTRCVFGISQDFSLEAAFKDALTKFTPESGSDPGLVEVVSMGALYGGFSGFSRLFVRLEKAESSRLMSPPKRAANT